MSSNRKSSRKKTVGRKPVRSSKKTSKTKYVNNYIKNPFKGIIECHKLIKNKKKRLYEEMMKSNPRSLRVLRGIDPKPNNNTEYKRKSSIYEDFIEKYKNYNKYYNEINHVVNLIESNQVSNLDLIKDKDLLSKLLVMTNKSRIELLKLDPELDKQVVECSKKF